MRRWIAAWPAALLLVAGLTGCEQQADRTVIAVLTYGDEASLAGDPGLSTLRDRIERRCPDCAVDPRPVGTGLVDLRGALDDGADVVLVEAGSGDEGEELVAAAGSVPLIAFDRFFAGADFFVSYDREATGPLVAEAVSRELGRSGTALLVDGLSTDEGTDVYESGLRMALADRSIEVTAEMEPELGTPDETRAWVADRLDRVGSAQVGAVLTVSEAQAYGATDAVADRPRQARPLVTGVGAGLDAVRRVISGEQTFAVHLPVSRTVVQAADVALSLASSSGGDDLEDSTDVEGVAAYVLTPVLVSRRNVTDALVRDGTYTIGQLCEGEVVAVCRRLGIV